ncbi:hypothetical protein KKC67_02695 [Patescibacteria group bacterium]|nr:hypothetical protein [Patescibacteria group bacterium]MBU0879692.1 hypothetical protein [Patescibacteria group bacterium]MBU0879925.1 hypothetical protein [Patescibacteria group bacterium]MBU0897804.1 hypothetical protein [Patescibacteria group bacterium]MBU1062714.1 hypothetical protein [Patescibacteria group bacterium]
MFKFKKSYLFIVAILVCGVGILNVPQAKAGGFTMTDINGHFISNDSAVIYWSANNEANCVISYSEKSDFNYGATVLGNIIQASSTNPYFPISYVANLKNLNQNTKYYFKIICSINEQYSQYGQGSQYSVESEIYEFSYANGAVKFKPDLIIKDIYVTPNCPITGGGLTGKIYVTVANIGDVATDSNKKIKISLVLESVLGLMTTYIDYIPASTTRNIAIDLNHNLFIGKSLKIIAFIDSDPKKDKNGNYVNTNLSIDESNENNNIFEKTFPICTSTNNNINKPDLTIKDIFIEGEKIKIKYCNDGDNPIKFDSFGVELIANNKTQPITSNNGNYIFLAKNGECAYSDGYHAGYFNLVNGVKYNIIAVIDYLKQVDESNENNNTFTKTITIGSSSNVDLNQYSKVLQISSYIIDAPEGNFSKKNTKGMLEYGDINKMYYYAEQGRQFLIRAKVQESISNPAYSFSWGSDFIEIDCSKYDYSPKTFYGSGWITCEGNTINSTTSALYFSIPMSGYAYIGGEILADDAEHRALFIPYAEVYVKNENCQSICKEIGTRSEGWYNSCTGNLIKWEKCSGAETCVKEGESLGAVVSGNNKQCCEGLKPYISTDSAGIKIIGTRGICRKGVIQIDSQITQINTNANQLHNNKLDDILLELKQLRDKIKEQATELKYLRNLTTGVKDLAQSAKDAINNFITYGVDANTQKLGAGERAAVINSYKSAFDKLPETEIELADVIKIANGRFPSITNDKAEKEAKDQFIKIYKRIADMNDANDSAAIKVMAYGLRQKAENRNLNSEKTGINSFKGIYGYTPKSTEDWNAMQAITYSGAKRMTDADKDLLSDEMEKKLGTNPNKADSDGDGYKDGSEVNSGYDPLKK